MNRSSVSQLLVKSSTKHYVDSIEPFPKTKNRRLNLPRVLIGSNLTNHVFLKDGLFKT